MSIVILKVSAVLVYVLTLNKQKLSHRTVSYNLEYRNYLKACQIARAGVPVYWEQEEKRKRLGSSGG